MHNVTDLTRLELNRKLYRFLMKSYNSSYSNSYSSVCLSTASKYIFSWNQISAENSIPTFFSEFLFNYLGYWFN